MIEIKVLDKFFTPFLNETEIEKAVVKLAHHINTDFKNETIHFLVVMNGAIRFTGDLLKHIQLDCLVECVKISSYRGISSGEIELKLFPADDFIKDKNVIIIEDIVDTGQTISFLEKRIRSLHPKSVSTCCLFLKPTVYKKTPPPYVGIEIPDTFVIGYGLDYQGHGRNLNGLFQLKT